MLSVNFMFANEEEAILPHPREPDFFIEKSCNADMASRNAELPTVNVTSLFHCSIYFSQYSNLLGELIHAYM